MVQCAPLVAILGASAKPIFDEGCWQVDIWLLGEGKSNSHGARPVYSNHLDDEVDSDQ